MTQNLEELREWHRKESEALAVMRAEMSELQRKALESEQRVRLLENLLALETGQPVAESGGTVVSTTEGLIEATVTLLEQNAGPLSIREIRERLVEREIPLPGRGADANLIAAFQRSQGRIVRVRRGQYDVPRGDTGACLVFPDGRTVVLAGEEIRLGRSDSSEIVLADSLASANHATLARVGDGWMITDLGSTNGTFVNDERIDASELCEGDVIRIGSTRFRFASGPAAG